MNDQNDKGESSSKSSRKRRKRKTDNQWPLGPSLLVLLFAIDLILVLFWSVGYSEVFEKFKEIVEADPTSYPDKMGKYSKWLINMYKYDKQLDLEKATEYLTLFDRFKSKIDNKDINQYKRLPELGLAIKDFYKLQYSFS